MCIYFSVSVRRARFSKSKQTSKYPVNFPDFFNFQQGAARIEEEEEICRRTKGDDCDMTLKNNIEAIIIKWAYQIDEVLSKDSAEELNVPDEYPGPMTEIQFWEAKCMNLESLYEQIKAPTTTKMASILDVTDSAYYPVFRSMYRNVVAALNEALDITLFLLPLTKLFKVFLQSPKKI